VSTERATLLLVHGAWHGSWCWERVVPLLEQRGIAVATVDLPSVGHARASSISRALSGDAAAVVATIDALSGPVVLCGHSYGGMVISHAAAGLTRVVGLVYLCAFVPLPGESLVASSGNQHAPWIQLLDDGMSLPDPSRAAEVFYADCDAATQAWAVSRLRPQHAAAFNEPVPRPAWREIPSTYVVCAEDRALVPDLQRTVFAPRVSHVLELAAGHSPFLSQPQRLADTLAAVVAQRPG
jgi:pimeloyl-ACP methyl ester carboxylesterase